MPEKQPRRFSLLGLFAGSAKNDQPENAQVDKSAVEAAKPKTAADVYLEMLEKATGVKWEYSKTNERFQTDLKSYSYSGHVLERLNSAVYPNSENKFYRYSTEIRISMHTLDLIPCTEGAFAEGNLVNCFDRDISRKKLMAQKLGKTKEPDALVMPDLTVVSLASEQADSDQEHKINDDEVKRGLPDAPAQLKQPNANKEPYRSGDRAVSTPVKP